jgi:hypothetical protein
MTTDSQTPTIAELEYTGRRHAENLTGLRAMDAHQAAELARLDAELERLAEYQARLPGSADAAIVHQAKKAIIDTELARGLMAEERARLQPELAATPQMIEDNKAAIAKLEAKAGS